MSSPLIVKVSKLEQSLSRFKERKILRSEIQNNPGNELGSHSGRVGADLGNGKMEYQLAQSGNVMGKLNCCVPNCVNSWRNSPRIKWHFLPKNKTILKEYRRLMRNETIKEFSPNTRICLVHFSGSERMLRTQLPSIFPWTEPSKTRRELVKNDLLNTRKRRKDEDKVHQTR